MTVWVGLPQSSRAVTRDTALEATAKTVVAANTAQTTAAHTRLDSYNIIICITALTAYNK